MARKNQCVPRIDKEGQSMHQGCKHIRLAPLMHASPLRRPAPLPAAPQGRRPAYPALIAAWISSCLSFHNRSLSET